MHRYLPSVGTCLVALLGLSACAKDKSSTTAPSLPAASTYSGLVVGDGVEATLAIAFPSPVASRMVPVGFSADMAGTQDDISATLTITGGGGTIDLTGTYTAPNLTLSGGGWTFTGTMSGGVITGTFTGPSGNGDFQALSSPQGSPATVMCGTSTGTDNHGQSTGGDFNLIAGSGVFVIVTGGGLVLPRGTYTGTTIDAYTQSVTQGGVTSTVRLNGSITATSASGTYGVTSTDGTSEQGDWRAGPCAVN